MSNTPSSVAAQNTSTKLAGYIKSTDELKQAVAVAFSEQSKTSRTVASAQDTPEVSQVSTSQAPSLDKPKLSASTMMLALMSLQTKVTNETVAGSLENIEAEQADIAKQNETRMNDSLTYFETMRQQDDVNGAMAISNVVIALLFVAIAVASLVSIVATGGASTLAVVAAGFAVASACCGVASSVVNLPVVQDSMDPETAQNLSLGLGITSLVLGLASLGTGIGAAAKSASQAGTTLTRTVKNQFSFSNKAAIDIFKQSVNIAMAGLGIVSSSMGIGSSTVNYLATETQLEAEEIKVDLEEAEADFDASVGDLSSIMESYSAMVESTAEMIRKAAEGAQSASSISA